MTTSEAFERFLSYVSTPLFAPQNLIMFSGIRGQLMPRQYHSGLAFSLGALVWQIPQGHGVVLWLIVFVVSLTKRRWSWGLLASRLAQQKVAASHDQFPPQLNITWAHVPVFNAKFKVTKVKLSWSVSDASKLVRLHFHHLIEERKLNLNRSIQRNHSKEMHIK